MIKPLSLDKPYNYCSLEIFDFKMTADLLKDLVIFKLKIPKNKISFLSKINICRVHT